MAAALIRGDLAVADWWLKSGRLSSIVFKKSVVDVSAELAGVDFKTQPHRYREHVICRILDSSIVQEMAIAACATDDLDLIRLCYRASASGDDHHGSNIDANAIPLSYLFASAAGHVPILDDLLARHGYPPAQFNNLSSLASSFAVELVPCILRTLPANWRNLTRAADMASAMNHVHVLEWWLTHVGPDQLHYSSLAVDMANRHGHLDVIHFWHRLAMDHGCEWRYSPETLVEAGRLARLDVLDWWINKCPVYMTFQFQPAFAAACNVGQVKVLDWCAAQMSLQWTMERIKPIVAKCGHWDTIKWYLDRGGTIADPVSLVARAWPQAMHLLLGCLAYNLSVRPLTQDEVGDVLWRGQSLFLALCIRHNLLPVVVDLDAAVTECAIAALDVLVASKYPVRYTPQAMQSATWSEDCVALDWWVGSGLKLKPPAKETVEEILQDLQAFDGAEDEGGRDGPQEVVEWWKRHWYLLTE
ncbi:hypothetical protein BCR44DRAFT_64556 [Catenaria anguillulae PL171]|uniref:Ankyrin repeat-containing domain protein n=1 Tax=Catenaria anguillulae PL171 TaxID=765915 RepID=A0A1Y2H7G2_9FUNG|nr:hypothetical protein BCR44DRAFT_64556 [Catenaria anguillulae PL171]